MENSYGIGVTNKYSVFLEDENGSDPYEALQNANKEKAEKKIKSTGKENKNATKVSNAKTSKKPLAKEAPVKPQVEARPVGRGGARRGGGSAPASDNREDRFNRRNRDDFREGRRGAMERSGGFSAFGQERDEERGSGRGRGRGRGGFRGGFSDNRGKREFDRQSGSDRSGVKAVDKREGGGRGNWGKMQDDFVEGSQQDGGEEHVEQNSDPEREAVATDEEAGDWAASEGPQEMTLDEWRKQQGERKVPQFNLRRAGEGEDQSLWNKTYELKKKVDSDQEEDDDEEEGEDVHHRHGRQKQHVMDIGFTFSDQRRGGRGRGRGSRGGEGFRGSRGGEGFRGSRGGEGFRGSRGGEGFRGSRGGEGFRGSRGGGEGFRGGVGGGGGEFGESEGFRANEFRGRGYRGNQRGSPRQHAPRVDDEHDFPSLG